MLLWLGLTEPFQTRPLQQQYAIPDERLSTNEQGHVIYKFKQPLRDRIIHVTWIAWTSLQV